MKIEARRLEGGAVALQFDGTEVRLSAADLKSLLLQITRLMVPGATDASTGADRLKALIQRMQPLADVAVQAFLMRAEHDDVVALVKAGESNPGQLDKFFRNMSDRSRKMCLEDVAYSFPDDLPPTRAEQAAHRLSALIRALEVEGLLPAR